METKDLSSEQFFEIISIERSDDGNFEAVLEVSESGKNGPGITETDIKCLEEEMKQVRNNDNDDNFSTAVLKFQEAVEQYSKSICDRLPKCLLDDENIEKDLEQKMDESENKQLACKSDEKFSNENASSNSLELKDSKKNTNDKRQSNHHKLKELVLLLAGFLFLFWLLLPDLDIAIGIYVEKSASNVMDGYIELTKLSDVPLRK